MSSSNPAQATRPPQAAARPVPRWWAARETRAAAVRARQLSAAAPDDPASGLPRSRSAALRRWQARRAADLQVVIRLIDAGSADELAARLDLCRSQRQRAAARGDAATDAATRPAALACAAVAMAPVLGHAVPAALLDAALAMGDGGAVALHSARERQLALALAAAVAAWSGRPLHLLVANDELAVAGAEQLAPLLAACSLRVAAVTAATPPRDSLLAYHADVVLASARRVAADLARDRRLRAAQAEQLGPGARPSLTRGQHSALIDDLDRVLIEDAMSPLVLSVEDDPTALVEAIAAAHHIASALQPGIDYRPRADGVAVFDAAGRQRLAGLVSSLPALWRTPGRCLMLVQQALFVRDGLREDIDFQRGPGGQPLFDDRLAERVPEREWMTGILQAVQLRLGLPPTPMSRTVERSSLQALFAGYHQLGGTGPCLDGLDRELWRCHGLLVPPAPADDPAPALPEPAPRCVASAAAQRLALQSLLPPAVAAGDGQPPPAPEAAGAAGPVTTRAVVLVLRRATDGQRWAALQRPGTVAMALEASGPAPALQALGWQGEPGAPWQPGLCLVLPEPLDSRRAETAFARRCADQAGAAVVVQRLLHPGARVLRDGLGSWSTVVERLCTAMPGAAPRLLPALLALARWRLHRQHAQNRLALLQRDHQLRQQLSFSGMATQTATAHRPGSPAGLGRADHTPASTGAPDGAPGTHPPFRATGPG